MEMTKYQLQASNKWSFDFVNESPITPSSTSGVDGKFQWESATLSDVPRFYHHIVNSNNNMQVNSESENIRPLTMPLPIRSIIISPTLSGGGKGVCRYNQTKITGELIN